jgi:hypothetical protein
MSLEGLRAWIGEVERKLAKRTRVFLVLAVIAIGIAGAAIYLAIDARESSVSEGDVQALQQQLETRIDELAAGTATAPASPETAPAPETTPAPEAAPTPKSSPNTESGADGAGTNEGATGNVPNGATGGDASAAQLQKLLEKAKERAEEAK